MASAHGIILPFFLIYGWDDFRFPSSSSTALSSVLYYGSLGAIFSLIIIDCYRPDAGFHAPAIDKRLGLLSYPLFLLHGPVIMFTAFLLSVLGIRMRFMLHFALLVAMALAVSYAVAMALERRVLAARGRLRDRAAAPQLALEPQHRVPAI